MYTILPQMPPAAGSGAILVTFKGFNASDCSFFNLLDNAHCKETENADGIDKL